VKNCTSHRESHFTCERWFSLITREIPSTVTPAYVGASVSNWGPSSQEKLCSLDTLHTSAPRPGKIGNWDWSDQPEPNAGCQLLTSSVQVKHTLPSSASLAAPRFMP
jgi:hypothetical protein